MGPLFRLILSFLVWAGSRILAVMFVFWLIGFLFPFVAVAVGIPYATFYDFAAHVLHPFSAAVQRMYDTAQCVR